MSHLRNIGSFLLDSLCVIGIALYIGLIALLFLVPYTVALLTFVGFGYADYIVVSWTLGAAQPPTIVMMAWICIAVFGVYLGRFFYSTSKPYVLDICFWMWDLI